MKRLQTNSRKTPVGYHDHAVHAAGGCGIGLRLPPGSVSDVLRREGVQIGFVCRPTWQGKTVQLP